MGTNRVQFACFLGAVLVSCSLAAGDDVGIINDKTLVAWVKLANTTQQAGSALTMIDHAKRFDAIVFGEISPGKWMAGSDTFNRTQRNQGSYAAEPADAGFVQMAIVYRGSRVTIYRNAKRYADYAIQKPQSFGPGSRVLLGLRYVGSMGERGSLAGAIDDARIYNCALTQKQIAALKPNGKSEAASLPKPVAWWTFEDGSPADAMKLYKEARLERKARIADGKLILDGRKSYVICTRPEGPLDRTPQKIFYKAKSVKTGNMWDVWLYYHEKTYYLYYLANAGRRWNNISMPKSDDGVHWREIGRVLHKGPGVTWMGTGSTWKSPNFDKDKKFCINFSEWKGPRQTIFFGESKDLVNWTRLGNEYEFKQDERWYVPKGRWDCIWTIARPGGGLYGYWTATPKRETGGRFGFGETLDGARWKALPPPKVHGVGGGEVGAIEKIGDKYYMMFGNRGRMVTLTADKPQGPFHAAKKNFSLLSGHTYFSRFFPTPDGVLVCHHSIARNRQVSFAPLKQAVIDAEGTMRLGWWKGNEKMKAEPVGVKPPSAAEMGKSSAAMLGGKFDAKKGFILEGTLKLPESKDAPRRGLYVEHGKDQGSGILIDSSGAAQVGPIKTDGSGFKAVKTVNREMAFAKPAKFRFLLKGSLLEFYLDDILIECFSLRAPATGRIGLFTGGKADSIGSLKAWR